MTENEKYVFNHFLIGVKAGFESLEDIVDDALSIVEEEGWEHEISEEWIRENVTREYNKNLESSKTWNRPTDVDRLMLAFDELSRMKVVTLHNAGYDAQDAVFDLKEVWEDAEDEDLNPIGYCYYTGQDLKQAITDNSLLITFGGTKEKDDKKSIIVGNVIAEVLKKSGFEIDWDNSASRPIEILDFKWQNLFVSDEDSDEKWGYDRTLSVMKA